MLMMNFPLNIDTLNVNYAQTDFFSSYTATYPPQNPLKILTAEIHTSSLGLFKKAKLEKNLWSSMVSTCHGKTNVSKN